MNWSHIIVATLKQSCLIMPLIRFYFFVFFSFKLLTCLLSLIFVGLQCPCASFAVLCPKTFPRNFPADGEVASLLRTCWRAKSATSSQQVVVMEFGKRCDTTDNGLLPAPTCYRLVVYVADLLQTYKFVVDLLRGNWCNGVWPLCHFKRAFS